MAKVAFNDAEMDALWGLPWLTQLIYMRVVRLNMDYTTGIVGVRSRHTKRISYQAIREAVEVHPIKGMKAYVSPTVKEIRMSLGRLIRAGLIERYSSDDNDPDPLVFKCLLADSDYSVQNKLGGGWTPNRAQSNPDTGQLNKDAESAEIISNDNTSQDIAPHNNTEKWSVVETDTGQGSSSVLGTPPVPEKITHSNSRASREKDFIPEDFAIDEQVKTLLTLSGVDLERAEFMLVEFVSANISSGHVSFNWAHEFVVFIRRFGWRYDAHKKNRHLAAVPNARGGFEDKDYSAGTNGFVKWGGDDENS